MECNSIGRTLLLVLSHSNLFNVSQLTSSLSLPTHKQLSRVAAGCQSRAPCRRFQRLEPRLPPLRARRVWGVVSAGAQCGRWQPGHCGRLKDQGLRLETFGIGDALCSTDDLSDSRCASRLPMASAPTGSRRGSVAPRRYGQ